MNATTKRKVEVFSAGCPCCEEAVKLVKSIACPSCEVTVLDMRNDRGAQAKAKEYGVKRVPAVVVNGKLAECCVSGGIDADTLRALGLGSPA